MEVSPCDGLGDPRITSPELLGRAVGRALPSARVVLCTSSRGCRPQRSVVDRHRER